MPRIRQNADKYAMTDLAAHIKGRMKDAGLRQEDLGILLQKSAQSVSWMLSHPDKIPLGTLRKICKAIDMDPAVVTKAAWCEKTKEEQK